MAQGWKNLSNNLLTEKDKAACTRFYLVEIDDQYFFTDCDKDLLVSARNYLAWPLTVSGFKNSDGLPLDGGEVSLGNVNHAISAYILNNLFTSKMIQIYEAWFDASMVYIDKEILFSGLVDGEEVDEEWAIITAAAFIFPWDSPSPRRTVSRMCTFFFKDVDCGYTGAATSCWKTRAWCASLGNEANFPGMDFIPAAGTKITWGSTTITVA